MGPKLTENYVTLSALTVQGDSKLSQFSQSISHPNVNKSPPIVHFCELSSCSTPKWKVIQTNLTFQYSFNPGISNKFPIKLLLEPGDLRSVITCFPFQLIISAKVNSGILRPAWQQRILLAMHKTKHPGTQKQQTSKTSWNTKTTNKQNILEHKNNKQTKHNKQQTSKTQWTQWTQWTQ